MAIILYILNILKLNKFYLNKSNKDLYFSQPEKVNNTSVIRHFPSSTKSWYNSVYCYDKNMVKSMPFLDKIVDNIIRMYFNLNSNVNLNKRNIRWRTKARFRSVRKIFVSKTEVKHFNDKIIINLYTYNKTKKYYTKKLSRLYRRIFRYIGSSNSRFNFIVNKMVSGININKFSFRRLKKKYRKEKKYKKYVKLYIYKYFSNLNKKILLFNRYNNLVYLKFKRIYRRGSTIFNRFLTRSHYTFKLLKNKNLYRIFNIIKNKRLYFKLKNLRSLDKFKNKYYNTFLRETLRKEMLYFKYSQLLNTDAYKFNNIYLSRLSNIIKNVYGKKIEFNIINLKYIYLDSHIFSESIALKIRNRKNNLIRILKKALSIQRINKSKRYKYNIQKLYLNRYNSTYKKDNRYVSNIVDYDVLHILLNKIFNTKKVYKNLEEKFISKLYKKSGFLARDKYIYRSIRFRKIRGVRLEAKGRLTRRLTASRAIFKVRYKGSLKNFDSSVNNLSSVMLRGYLKSNLDYVNLNSKTRNGCFGLKGWISS